MENLNENNSSFGIDIVYANNPPNIHHQMLLNNLVTRYGNIPVMDIMNLIPNNTQTLFGDFGDFGDFGYDSSLSHVLERSMDEGVPELKRDKNIVLCGMKDIEFNEKTLNDSNCAICLTPFKKKDEINEISCKHIFHSGCISEWGKYKQSCPVCRTEIKCVLDTEEEVVEEEVVEEEVVEEDQNPDIDMIMEICQTSLNQTTLMFLICSGNVENTILQLTT